MKIFSINPTMQANLYQNKNQQMSPLQRQQMNLQNQMKEISENQNLSQEEKNNQIQKLQEQVDELNTQLGKQQLEEIQNTGKKVAEEMSKKVENGANEEEKRERASIAIQYGMIAASSEASSIGKLTYERGKAVREAGEGSDRVKRIDSMLANSIESAESNIKLTAKALAEYAKVVRKENEKSGEKDKHSIKESEMERSDEKTTGRTDPSDAKGIEKDSITETASATHDKAVEIAVEDSPMIKHLNLRG